jgi:hypothetical protein
MDKPPISKALSKGRNMLGKDVRMDIDDEWL